VDACAQHRRHADLLLERLSAGGFRTEHAIESVRRRVETLERETTYRYAERNGFRSASDYQCAGGVELQARDSGGLLGKPSNPRESVGANACDSDGVLGGGGTMNPETGAMAVFETDDDAVAAGHTVPLNAKDAQMLTMMNRHDRRAWAADQRRDEKRRARRGREQKP
jgi:hypothetical protein